MAKAKQTPVESKTITLTTEQYAVLFKVQSLLDNASDTLGDIDGDGNLFEIGRSVGDATGDIINAFNELGDLIDQTNPNDLDDNDFQFVTNHNLKGLYSGMFISEVGEAHYCGLPNTPQSIVDMSNDSFARWMGENANMTLTEIFHNTMDNYEVLAMDNPVADYNAQRLCLAE
jgi:hypothetical protein